VSEAALVEIVGGAVAAVDGARLRRKRRLSLDLESGRAELEISAPLGSVLPETARAVQERVGEALAQMCGVKVGAVDVAVVELTR
jgi:uncharacterized alkaline shock family protein YloU